MNEHIIAQILWSNAKKKKRLEICIKSPVVTSMAPSKGSVADAGWGTVFSSTLQFSFVIFHTFSELGLALTLQLLCAVFWESITMARW